MKRRDCAPLSQPQEKRRTGSGNSIGSPLPVPITTLTGVPSSNNYWSVYYGTLEKIDSNKHRVVIREESMARVVYSNGFFGDIVVAGKVEDKARPVLEDWRPGLAQESEKVMIEDKKTETVSSWSQVKAKLSDCEEKLELHLELCEAWFLSYCLGCLVITCAETYEEMSLINLWNKFRILEPDFPVRYRVYHHFRCRGWVVRSGATMGSDWVLYKMAPTHFHSTYTVRIEIVDQKTGQMMPDVIHHEISKSSNEKDGNDEIPDKTSTEVNTRVGHVTWSELLGHARVMGTVKKDLIIARVGVESTDWEKPNCLNSMTVTSHRIRRWVPTEQRWKQKPKVPVLTIE